MSQDDLHALLDQLRAEIDSLGEDDDAAARERLGALVTDLERRLEEPDHAELESHEDFVDSIRETVERLEVEYPRATGILNNIMVTLGSMGI